MSRLTRDGTAEPVSRDQIPRHARGQGNTNFPVQMTTSRIGNLTRLIHTLLYVMTIHTYIHTLTDRYESSRGHKIDGTKPNQTENNTFFGDKQGKQTDENGQESSQQRTSSR